MTLALTLAHVRDRETAHLGTKGRPNAWWPGGASTNDCVGYQTYALGLRTGHESLASLNAHREWISIAAFRAHYDWPEVAPSKIEAGDLLLENWDGDKVGDQLEAEHMEYCYSVNHSAGTMVIIGANTGPAPGVTDPNGCWKKTRQIDDHILRAIRPPYASAAPSRSRKAEVKLVADWLNKTVPHGPARTAADKDGIEGPNYWRLVQTWGRANGYYPHQYVIDGIPGPQSRIVEARAYVKAKATAKK